MSAKILISSNDREDSGEDSNEDHITKKVHFKKTTKDAIENIVVDLSPKVVVSWSGIINEEDLVFVEGDILRSNVNGISTIDFSEHIKKWLVKNMETTIVVKLLG
ncbi:hypothetical protein PVK06_023205 [Gossypium arboreum]|uniref:Uncharacterized protein n=1 Tax=Gossypium arboreum TaxID=29729 RepID=A0ABR0PAG5_GOSAR|nr:hypothetical protein PVK06_023205 [Gossypium arboreum]